MRILDNDAFLDLLDRIPPDLDGLQVRRHLGDAVDPGTARALAEQVALRQRAASKFARTQGLLLTGKGLEQASPLPVARRRAARIAAWPGGSGGAGPVLDATAGLGCDAIALAAAGVAVVASDADPWTARCLGQNLRAHGFDPRVVVARAQDRVVSAPFLVLDPDRRAPDGTRTGDPARWSPPWSAIEDLLARSEGAVVKLAPATTVESIEREARERGRTLLEWVSWNGELKEVALWTGALVGGDEDRIRRAVALRGADRVETLEAGDDERAPVAPLTPSEAAEVAWIAEPDPAVLRAGLLEAQAGRSGARPLGPGIAYLGADERPRLPLLSSFRVLDTTPVDRRRVRAMLGRHDVGPLTVKRRGHPQDADTLAKRFRGPGKKRGLLVVARLEEGHRAWLVERVTGK